MSMLRTGFWESDQGKAKVKGGGLFILNLEGQKNVVRLLRLAAASFTSVDRG